MEFYVAREVVNPTFPRNLSGTYPMVTFDLTTPSTLKIVSVTAGMKEVKQF